MPARSIIYIDGFILYYGAVRGGAHKWLNLQQYFQLLRQDDDIQAIYYFNALVDGPARGNQETYFRALSTLPLVTVVLGKFKLRSVECTLVHCNYPGPRHFKVPEEKRTDVNIAIQLLDDAYNKRAERFVIVSGDSDLVPAIQLVKSRFPQSQVVVYVPARHPVRAAAVEMRAAGDKDRTLPLALLKYSQFPATLADGHGDILVRPADW